MTIDIVDFPIKNCDFPQLCEITGGYLCLKVTWDLTSASKLGFELGIEAWDVRNCTGIDFTWLHQNWNQIWIISHITWEDRGYINFSELNHRKSPSWKSPERSEKLMTGWLSHDLRLQASLPDYITELLAWFNQADPTWSYRRPPKTTQKKTTTIWEKNPKNRWQIGVLFFWGSYIPWIQNNNK